ncbi:hypothetical protein [Alteromonas sp. C1M14]|uniref:hypothetical protein n=1 Tax=Alteromonas sp. C1M14 TaxID=2841567 RepID=UPI001C09AF04|nr:hypothetical protein [Alteromonas sp. C1M14]MBU2978480.1 hypothetical protein [Alteromonas sp. C1M14]
MSRFKKKLNRINMPIFEIDHPYLNELDTGFFSQLKNECSSIYSGGYDEDNLVLCDFAVEESLSIFIDKAYAIISKISEGNSIYVVNSSDVYTTIEEAALHNQFPTANSKHVIYNITIDSASTSRVVFINNDAENLLFK